MIIIRIFIFDQFISLTSLGYFNYVTFSMLKKYNLLETAKTTLYIYILLSVNKCFIEILYENVNRLYENVKLN